MTAFLILLVVGLVIWGIVRAALAASAPAGGRRARRPYANVRSPAPSEAPALGQGLVTAPRPSAQRRPTAAARWIPPGQSIEVAGLVIDGGMIYMGSSIAWTDEFSREPSVVDTSLPVSRTTSSVAPPLHYYPSYRDLTPDARRWYLEWLAGGRCCPLTEIGYAFIFFYGLERRLLVDLPNAVSGHDGYPELREELVRLRLLYAGISGSFDGYSGNLLDFCDVLHGMPDLSTYRPEEERQRWDCPLRLKLGLGMLVAEGHSLPWNWALAWYLLSPQRRPSLRTPAVRCADEFRRLFEVRYTERFGPGMVIKPNKTKLTVAYHSASSALGEFTSRCEGISDVTALSAPLNKIDDLVQSCTDELDSYSRFVGRDGTDPGSPLALSLLPAELVSEHPSEDLVALREWLGALIGDLGRGVTRGGELTRRFLGPDVADGKISRRDMERLVALMENCGFGMEPDPRFDGARFGPEDPVVVYIATHGICGSPSPTYLVAQIVTDLFWLVASSDGAVGAEEPAHLVQHLKGGYDLDEAEKARLSAHSRWLAHARPGTSGLKKRIVSLSADQKRLLGQFLVGVAAVGGGVTPEEIKVLTRIYGLLDLDEGQLHSDIHSLATASAPDEPVLIAPASPTSGVRIPERSAASGLALDPDLIKQRARETAQVSALLEAIFSEADQAQTEGAEIVECLEGLDEAHSALVRDLAGRDCVSWEEWAQLTERHGLLPDGALDTVNECALELYDDFICEGDETLTINRQVLKEML